MSDQTIEFLQTNDVEKYINEINENYNNEKFWGYKPPKFGFSF